jgi:hypothetical protein
VGHLIELNLIHPVKELMAAKSPVKRGHLMRPYLDYALRYDPKAEFRLAVVGVPCPKNPAMVELLLGNGCDVNEPAHIYGGRTVWALYLAFLSAQECLDKRDCKTTWLLIKHGAKPIKAYDVGGKWPQKKKLSMKEILVGAFGDREAEKMCERIAKNGSLETRNWSSIAVVFFAVVIVAVVFFAVGRIFLIGSRFRL